MSVPSVIRLNSTVPAAPAGYANVKPQHDSGFPIDNTSFYAPNLGGVDSRSTTTETIRDASLGKAVLLTAAGATAVTLDSAHVPSGFMCWCISAGAGGATLTPSSGTIDGAANLALTTNQGVSLFWDGTNWKTSRGISSGGGGGLNGVNVQTTDYPVVSGDNGKLVVMNSASTPRTITLLNPPPSATWAVFIQNIGAASLTVSRNTLNIDGAAANLTLAQNQGVVIFTDGTNYFTERGMSAVALLGGDLSPNSSTSQEVIGILNKAIDGSAPTDGQILQYSSSTGKWEMLVDRPIFPVSAVVGKPNAGQLVCMYTAAASMIFPANFASPNSYGSLSTNPAATADYQILKNGTHVGDVSISTSGVFTFTTVGGATITLNAGDRLTITAPNPADTTLADVSITLVGTRSATVPSTAVPPILNWRGTYSGGATYQPWDVAYYSGSSYVCILTTTGNLPTNATYWSLLAQAGAAGGVQIGTDLGGTFLAPTVVATHLSSSLPVNQGGTGAATLGANGVLIGEGTGAVGVTGAGTIGQVLTSNGAGNDPTFQTAAAGLASGANVIIGQYTSDGTSPGFGNFTVFVRLDAFALLGLPSSWKIAVGIASAVDAHVGNAKILKCTKGSTTVASSTTVQWGGSSTPTLTNNTIQVSDAISLTLDYTHDWWIAIYFTNTTNPNLKTFSKAGYQASGYISTDHTGDSTIPSLTQVAGLMIAGVTVT